MELEREERHEVLEFDCDCDCDCDCLASNARESESGEVKMVCS
jgi:hypothetical protein